MSLNISVEELTPHPANKDIYGDESEGIKELAEQIRQSGYIVPLFVNQDNVIISGHRRYLACLLLKIKELPCERLTFKDESDELEKLLIANQYREKTNFQKTKEAERWEVIEKLKARQRQATNTGDVKPQLMEDVPEAEKEKGNVRDILAKRVGLGSGRNLDKAKLAKGKIEELQEQGNIQDVNFLKTVLNGSVSAAKDLSALESLDAISSDLKDQVINKEMPVNKAVQKIKKNLASLKEDDTKETDIVAEDTKAEDLVELEASENTESSSADLPTPIEELQPSDERTDTFDNDSIITEFNNIVDKFVKNMNNYMDMEILFEDANADKVDAIIEKALNVLSGMQSKIY